MNYQQCKLAFMTELAGIFRANNRPPISQDNLEGCAIMRMLVIEGTIPEADWQFLYRHRTADEQHMTLPELKEALIRELPSCREHFLRMPKLKGFRIKPED